jgi:hypothetical protein
MAVPVAGAAAPSGGLHVAHRVHVRAGSLMSVARLYVKLNNVAGAMRAFERYAALMEHAQVRDAAGCCRSGPPD